MCNPNRSPKYDLVGLSIPEITDQLLLIQKATSGDPTLEEFSTHLLHAIDELVALRRMAHNEMQARDREQEFKSGRQKAVRHVIQ